jgi:hypothetical protein
MPEKLRLSMKFIKEAKEQLQRYEATSDELYLHQACEKGWGAVAHVLKAVNPEIKRHRDFGKTAAKLAEEYNEPEIAHGEAFGELLHRSGFYEGDLDITLVIQGLRCIENFLKLMDDILNQKG